MISMKKINKDYIGDTYKVNALKNVSLNIDNGEFVSIMGKSGSGKTTLLNIIGFLDVCSSGEYSFSGQEVGNIAKNELWKYRRENVGFVFQHFALINHMNVIDNVALPLEALGQTRYERYRRSRNVLEMLGIADLEKKYPGNISGGQKQRVAIARALVGKSKIILADEPTGALDQNTGQEILDIFKRINNDGKTVVLVTHDEKIAEQTKRIINIDCGEIVSDRMVV